MNNTEINKFKNRTEIYKILQGVDILKQNEYSNVGLSIGANIAQNPFTPDAVMSFIKQANIFQDKLKERIEKDEEFQADKLVGLSNILKNIETKLSELNAGTPDLTRDVVIGANYKKHDRFEESWYKDYERFKRNELNYSNATGDELKQFGIYKILKGADILKQNEYSNVGLSIQANIAKNPFTSAGSSSTLEDNRFSNFSMNELINIAATTGINPAKDSIAKNPFTSAGSSSTSAAGTGEELCTLEEITKIYDEVWKLGEKIGRLDYYISFKHRYTTAYLHQVVTAAMRIDNLLDQIKAQNENPNDTKPTPDTDAEKSNTLLYAGIGIGLVGIGVTIYFMLR